MKRILITGISGFVGTNLVRFFQDKEEVKVIGYSRDIQKTATLFAEYDIEFIPELSSEKLDQYKIDTIIHLAGIAHDLSGKFGPEDYYKVNYQKTAELYDAFLKSKAQTFIFISSIKAVVDHTDQIITEDFTPSPASDYGISKLKAEEYIRNQISNKRYFILQPCMIHGPGNKGNLNMLYKFVKTGIPYPLGAFENARSFLSIDNFSFAIDKLIESELQSDTYLLSDDDPISTNDLIRLIGDEVKRKVIILKLPQKLVWALARIGSMIRFPFNTQTISKLCENMVVSNQKLLVNLNENLPVSSIDGLKKTIKSFDE